MKVHLTYFKPSGKVYAGEDYESICGNTWDVIAEVERMRLAKSLPGLSKGHSDFYVLVTIETPKYTDRHLLGLPNL